ncbi:MAG: cob(I)yrinic acid a,c-diamide adenosyltransferase [Lachnoclostridium sp.]|nr:cob(I)yrinic acid a,c-diamide adenosyltransferase [Lachnoclostridium sp.]
MEKSKIYTRGGDRGMTSLVGGTRVKKNDCRVEAYGTADELNSTICLLATEINPIDPKIAAQLIEISSTLFNAGSYLASIGDEGAILPPVSAERVAELEKSIDSMDSELPPFKCFLLPGGHHASALAHVARTQCRRTERRIYDVIDAGYTVDPIILEYFNRLSDYLFLVARYINHLTSTPEVRWTRR